MREKYYFLLKSENRKHNVNDDTSSETAKQKQKSKTEIEIEKINQNRFLIR